MEEILEKDKLRQENNGQRKESIKEKKQKKNRSFTILGFSIWRLFAYFILYSIAGYVIETIFGALTKGVIESRQSFLYGPFCAIYGVGAVIMIVFLQYFKKNNFSLFFGGVLIGSVVEYIVSWVGELISHIKWWDYSGIPFNINGRICILFSLMWGILAIFLITYLNPKMNTIIEWIKTKVPKVALKTIVLIAIIIMFIDFQLTGFALKMFFARIVENYDLELQNIDEYVILNETEEKLKEFAQQHFDDERMLKTFPNIKLIGKDGNIIYVSDILRDIQPYYVRIFTPKIHKRLSNN